MDVDNLEHSYNQEFIRNLEKYKLLTGSTPVSLLISTCLAVIMSAVLHGQLAYESLLAWLVVVLFINITRLLVFTRFHRSHSGTHNQEWIQFHLRVFRFGTLLSGLVWGWAGFVFAQQVDFTHQLFITFTLGGLTVGATSSLATDKLAIIGFILATLMPNTIHYFISGSQLPVAMGLMLLLFIGFMLNAARLQGKHLHENLNLRIQAKQQAKQFREVLDFSPVSVSIFSLDTEEVLYINKRYLELFSHGFNPFNTDNETGFSIEESQIKSVKSRVMNNQRVSNLLLKLTSPRSSEVKWCIGSFLPINYLDTPSILSWFYDITDRVEMEEKIRHLAYHDALTDLPNRYLFEDRLSLALRHAQRNQKQVGVLFIDLDGFKTINDTYGHDVGDLLLKAVSDRVRLLLRTSDTLSPVGGDEFIVLLPEIAGRDNALHVAEKLLDALAQVFEVGGAQLQVSASIGLAIYPEHGNDDQTLLKHADIAMYEAKKLGKNNVQVFSTQN